jgi:hypothetical protein
MAAVLFKDWARLPVLAVGWLGLAVLTLIRLWQFALNTHAALHLRLTLRRGDGGETERDLEIALSSEVEFINQALLLAFWTAGCLLMALGTVLFFR